MQPARNVEEESKPPTEIVPEPFEEDSNIETYSLDEDPDSQSQLTIPSTDATGETKAYAFLACWKDCWWCLSRRRSAPEVAEGATLSDPDQASSVDHIQEVG